MSLDTIIDAIGVEPYFRDDAVAIYHADCRDILPKIPQVDLVLTDPPYGINLGSHEGARETRPGLLIRHGGYEDTPTYFSEVVVPAIKLALSLALRSMIFCVPPSMWQLPAPDAIGGMFIAGAVGRNRWGWSNLIHCLLYGCAPNLQNGARPTAMAGNATAEQTGHPTTKPLVWLRWATALGSAEGDTILDPFMGSGTTLRAAKDLGRYAIGIEIEEKYCEIAKRRMAQGVLL